MRCISSRARVVDQVHHVLGIERVRRCQRCTAHRHLERPSRFGFNCSSRGKMLASPQRRRGIRATSRSPCCQKCTIQLISFELFAQTDPGDALCPIFDYHRQVSRLSRLVISRIDLHFPNRLVLWLTTFHLATISVIFDRRLSTTAVNRGVTSQPGGDSGSRLSSR